MKRAQHPPYMLLSCFLGCVLLGSTVFSWLGFFVFYSEKKPFSVGLVYQLFQSASNYCRLKRLKSIGSDRCRLNGPFKVGSGLPPCCFPQLVNAGKSGNNFSQELPRFNRKRLEKCSIGKPQPLQPKPVAVETVDPNRTRL